MAFNCRIFFYSGIQQMKNELPKQFSSDSVFVLVQPYLAADLVVADVAAVNSDSAPVGTNIVRIEVPDGETIRYEMNPPNRTGGVVAAGSGSPSLSGKDQYYCREGWSLSIINAAALP